MMGIVGEETWNASALWEEAKRDDTVLVGDRLELDIMTLSCGHLEE